MSKHYNFFYVRALENGSLFVGPNYKVLADTKERENILLLAHKALKEASVDVSRIQTDDYGEVRFYINNKIEAALDILQDIDDDY
ncbi:MAG: hypothetical protein FK733_09145 [Asgard group archaeon]|nr:hypothetical protein [Asgard group archaeon]